MQRRVVVTGMGCVAPIGNNLRDFWNNLKGGKSGISEISSFDAANFKSKIAGEIKDFNIDSFFNKSESRKMDRFVQFAAVAAKSALKAAKIGRNSVEPERFGVFLGTGFGGIKTLEEQHEIFIRRGPKRVSPFCAPMMISNMASGCLAILFGAKGVNGTISTACSSSANAIGAAFRTIQNGKADVMISGGSEAAITPFIMAAFASMRALSTKNDAPQKASSPFDKNRDGFVMAEGGAILILEELEHAKARNCEIYAEIVGFASSADAFHIVLPSPDGLGAVNSMKAALDDAKIDGEAISYINAHGTGTIANDGAETKAIKSLFGKNAYKIPVSSTKSVTGHLLGAAGAIEAVASICAINRGEIPPTINLETPDAECDLDYVPNFSRRANLKYVLSNSFGFGGQNSTIIFKKF